MDEKAAAVLENLRDDVKELKLIVRQLKEILMDENPDGYTVITRIILLEQAVKAQADRNRDFMVAFLACAGLVAADIITRWIGVK